MKITKRQLRKIIREEALSEGIWDSIKGAVGMGPKPEEAGMEIQNAFEKMGNGVAGMLKLARKGSQMAKYWESLTGEERPEALMRGNIPSEFYRSQNQGGHGNILNSIGKFKDHFYDSMWNALAAAAPDAHDELDQIFRDLASKPSDRTARKLRDIGVKIKDEALSSGDEDALVKFNKLFKQWAGEQINQTSFNANSWFNQHQGSFGLGESVVRITRKQLRRIIGEAVTGTAEHGRHAGTPWIDVVMNSLADGDADSATQAVLDSYMFDDTWQSEEDALENMLDAAWSQDPSVENIQDAVEWWYIQMKDGMYRPKDGDEEREDWARGAAKAKARAERFGSKGGMS